MRDYVTAQNHFDNAVQLSPDQPLYWYYRGLTFRQMGDPRRGNNTTSYWAFTSSRKAVATTASKYFKAWNEYRASRDSR